jgi:hypothetical protein
VTGENWHLVILLPAGLKRFLAFHEKGGINMIKSYTMIKLNDTSISDETIKKRWIERHAPIAVKNIPGMLKYVINMPVRIPEYEWELFGLNEMWWKSEESYRNYLKWRETPAADELKVDEKEFFETCKLGLFARFMGKQYVVKDFDNK